MCGREQIFVEIAPGGVVMRGNHNSLDNNGMCYLLCVEVVIHNSLLYIKIDFHP